MSREQAIGTNRAFRNQTALNTPAPPLTRSRRALLLGALSALGGPAVVGCGGQQRRARQAEEMCLQNVLLVVGAIPMDDLPLPSGPPDSRLPKRETKPMTAGDLQMLANRMDLRLRMRVPRTEVMSLALNEDLNAPQVWKTFQARGASHLIYAQWQEPSRYTVAGGGVLQALYDPSVAFTMHISIYRKSKQQELVEILRSDIGITTFDEQPQDQRAMDELSEQLVEMLDARGVIEPCGPKPRPQFG